MFGYLNMSRVYIPLTMDCLSVCVFFLPPLRSSCVSLFSFFPEQTNATKKENDTFGRAYCLLFVSECRNRMLKRNRISLGASEEARS